MQKRIVVLGGVGFIGTHLRLLEEGHEVFCVDIRDAVNSPLLRGVLQHPLFRYVHHNIINGFSIRCDEIYNLASPSRVRYNKALPVETLRVSVLGAINTLETARSEHARVVFASAGNIYGIGHRDPASEPGNFCSTHYILYEGKRAAEALHRAYNSEYDVDARIARIFNTYGSGADPMDQRVVIKMVVAALQNRDIVVNGSGEQLRTFCWVEDLVEGLVRLMETPPSAGAVRTVNLGSNRGSYTRRHGPTTQGGVHPTSRQHAGSWAGCPGHRSQKGCAARSAMRKRSWRTKPTPGSHGRR